MVYIDAHCHIDLLENINSVITNAKESGVAIIINNGVNVKTNRLCLVLSSEYREIQSALGIYPIDALSMSEKEIDEEINFIKKNKEKIIAIGEVGLDYKEDEKDHEKQKQTFRKLIALSLELNKPIFVHSRKAEEDCINILEEMKAKKVIMHCFSGKLSLVKRIIDNGWFLTIPTNVTFSEHFQKVIQITPITQLLCETDSPFLHPFKEKNNEPKFVVESYKKVAEIKNIPLKDVEKQIENNYKKLFLIQ